MILLSSYLSLIIDIFKLKNIEQGVYYHCQYPEKIIEMQRKLFKNNIRLQSAKIDYNNTEEILFSHSKIAILLNGSCGGWPNILERHQVSAIFKSPFVWTIFTNNFSAVLDVLSFYPIEVDSDVMVVEQNDKIFDLYDVYNTGFYTQGKFKVNKIGYFNGTLHYQSQNRYDLSGVKLRCISVINQRLVAQTFEDYLEESKPNKRDSLHRLKYYTPLKYLRDMFNISYFLQRTKSWGYLRNGSFDGLVGALQRRESDIGCSPVFIRKERAEVLDYVIQTWDSKQIFILRHPKYPEGFYGIYIRPLSKTVWYYTFALLALTGSILCFMLKLRGLRAKGDGEDSSYSLALLCVWSAVCQQGVSLQRRSTSVKLVMFVTFVFSVTLYQYYNATVVSTLLREPPKNIRTLEDLLKSNIKAGMEDILYNKDFFMHTTDPIALEIYHKKIATDKNYNYFPPSEGMALVKKGGFAFHVEGATGYAIMRDTFSEREVCEAHEVTLYPPQTMGAVIAKESPYKEHLAYGICKMFETGIMNRIKSVWDEPRPACVHTPDSSIFSVSIREFSLALILLVSGMFLASVIFLCELILHRFRKEFSVIEFRN